MFQFDDFGYLQPYEVIPLDLETFERTFVLGAERERLFQALLNLVLDLKNLGAGAFHVWADGSFVTKKRVPRDIDVVVFVRFDCFEVVARHLERLEKVYEGDLDIFLVPDYPDNHPGYADTFLRKESWKRGLGTTGIEGPKVLLN